MQQESLTIMKNLGYTETLISSLKRSETDLTGIIQVLEELGTPDSAINQIKKIESTAQKRKKKRTKRTSDNKELIESLIKRCRRSLNAFAKKGVTARVVFKKNKPWVIEAPEYHPAIQHLHDVCKKHFDVWSRKGISVVFQFSGSKEWTVITRRKTDQPDNI